MLPQKDLNPLWCSGEQSNFSWGDAQEVVQWVDDIQSAPFFLWVIHESKNEVVGNGLNKRIHAIFWQLNFQSRIKSWIFSQERNYDLEELSRSLQQLLKTRQVRPHLIISLFLMFFCPFLLDCSMVWNTLEM